jgi:hypothetical protein
MMEGGEKKQVSDGKIETTVTKERAGENGGGGKYTKDRKQEGYMREETSCDRHATRVYESICRIAEGTISPHLSLSCLPFCISSLVCILLPIKAILEMIVAIGFVILISL